MAATYLKSRLALPRCPYCGIANPYLVQQHHLDTNGSGGRRWWWMYVCTVCGGVVLAASDRGPDNVMSECYPSLRGLSEHIPERPREFLRQARESLGQPVGAIMLCASAVDAILKDHKLKEGSLYTRIDQAKEQGLITDGMAKWAHQVRLDANDQRHADEAAPLPSQKDAERCLSFTSALAEILYVIPARVTRGIEDSKPPA